MLILKKLKFGQICQICQIFIQSKRVSRWFGLFSILPDNNSEKASPMKGASLLRNFRLIFFKFILFYSILPASINANVDSKYIFLCNIIH